MSVRTLGRTKVVLRNSLHGMAMRKDDLKLKAWVDPLLSKTGDGPSMKCWTASQGHDLHQA